MNIINWVDLNDLCAGWSWYFSRASDDIPDASVTVDCCQPGHLDLGFHA